ncbi:hypothetical protein LG943_12700 [Streptomonospora sp. S1-112]|uniref:Uncharacterized protein n=1 Tax=Streptomonospora mangrovi TaxID=2883123 RepID=A0A9X3SDS1_9ACTN|nr:hypothetical protein [Streptomonospora mangrovi]MDA0565168.1 hypothetical protein [Streptomonospora mangrovi]
MITLPHTGMQAPHNRMRATNLNEVDLDCGVAFTALLCEGAAVVGTIVNEGQGGPTYLRAAHEAHGAFSAFATQCRDRHGAPLTEEHVLDNLVDEHEYARQIASAERRKRHVVRYFDTADIPTSGTFALRSGRVDYNAAWKAAPRLTAPAGAVRAEIWMGDDRGWVAFTPA